MIAYPETESQKRRMRPVVAKVRVTCTARVSLEADPDDPDMVHDLVEALGNDVLDDAEVYAIDVEEIELA